MTSIRRRGAATSLVLTLIAGVSLAGMSAPAAHAASRHSGWCTDAENGLAVLVDFSHLKSSLWPNSRGYVVTCIDPNVSAAKRAGALDVTGISHQTSGDEVTSILGLAKDNQVWGWVHGVSNGNTMTWVYTNDTRPNPQADGFEYWLALSSQYDQNTIPSIQPQFASAGSGGGGGDSDGSLEPGAPKQTYNPGGGGGGNGGAGNGGSNGSGGSGSGGSNGTGRSQNGTGGGSGSNSGTNSGTNSRSGSNGAGSGVAAQQSAQAAAKAKAQASAKAKASTSPTPKVSARPSDSVSPVYAAEKPKGSAELAKKDNSGKNWMWAGIGLGAVMVAAGVTAGIEGVTNRRKKAAGATKPPSDRPSGRR